MNKIIDRSYKELFKREFVLYVFIGAFSAGLDFVVFYILFNFSDMNAVPATIISTFIGFSNSFLLNSFFNFKKTDHFAERFFKFMIAGFSGIIISALMLAIGSSVLGLDANLVKLSSILIVGLMQYLFNSRITFR